MTFDATAAAVNRTQDSNIAYWITAFLIAVIIAFVDVTTNPINYVDINTYLLYLSQLLYAPAGELYVFETLANAFLLGNYWLFGTVDAAVIAAHYELGLIFLSLILFAVPPRETSWQSLVFIFALIGPLMAFVTLRATPAYCFAAIAVRYAMQRDHRTWTYLIIALFFHASAGLAVAPVVLLFYRSALPRAVRNAKPSSLIIVGAILASVALFSASSFGSYVSNLLVTIPNLAKYLAYLNVDDSAPTRETSAGHYLYLLFIVAFLLIYIARSRRDMQDFNIFILSSFFVYVLLFVAISPVAAFRQSPFWLIPVIARYPWQRAGVAGPANILFVAFSIGLFYFQFIQVYLQ